MSDQQKIAVRLAVALTCLVLTGCHSLTDTVAQAFFLPKDGRPANHAVETRRDAGFTTTDGVTLLADVHRPKGIKKTPTLLIRIPFSNTWWNVLRSDSISRYWAARGYTVVVQGTRGRYRSGGDFYPMKFERQDGIETLQWIARQSWYDGHIGMWGGSAFGQTQWIIADQTNPGVDAFFIQIASTDFAHVFHVDGAFALESALYWALQSHGEKDIKVDYAQLDQGARGLPVIDADNRACCDVPFFNDWALNAPDSAYWKEVDGENQAARTSVPVLLLAGWYDPFLRTMLQDFATLRTRAQNSHLVIGPYAHAEAIKWPDSNMAENYRFGSVDPALRWYDHQFGLSDAPLDMAPVRLFVLGENRWRDEQEWPLARTRWTNFHLTEKGGLTEALPAGVISDSFIYDPLDPVPTAGGAMLGYRSGIKRQNDIEARPDVLSYTSTPLDTALEATGPLKASLWVSTDAPSTDFTVKLVDVFPDGRAYNLADGILRRTYNPGEPTLIEIDLAATSVVFGQGHRIRVEISSSNYPRFDRNPNTGESSITATRTQIAHQTLWHDTERPSHIVLPVIPR
ncbi:MAG: CocE/NonD family hydrolase [Gallionellaceae bacterium]|jgi:putative CocE/NonD family hydrolase|nr:CocE/NonD family hydrolase [Gallionellaceae bacterium]